jgi:DNA topoisomerase-1
MRTFTPPAGVDLHARMMFLVILDRDGKIVFARNLPAAPEPFLLAVAPFRDGVLVGCECMHCWYWLADTCRDEKIAFVLGHAWAMKAVHGYKTKCDRKDADAIARLLERASILAAAGNRAEAVTQRGIPRDRCGLLPDRHRRHGCCVIPPAMNRNSADPHLRPSGADSAHAAGLRYVSDAMPGIHRRRSGQGFVYVNAKGRRICDSRTLQRIRSLVIPPAWTDVWICPLPKGHLQAVGRDRRGRKQYRHHPRWRAVRDHAKYGRLYAFGQALPSIRAKVDRDLRRPGLTRRKVLAALVRLLETTLIRVGNEEYARQNGSFGLTTMRNRHADVDGARIRFRFRGKSGRQHTVELQDRRLARTLHSCLETPGHYLFQYLDDNGQAHLLGSADVNDYLRKISGRDFTAKDFRTWAGTVLAARALRECEAFDSKVQAKRNIAEVIESVAERLGNTKAVCRKSYVHPALLDGYLDGCFTKPMKPRIEEKELKKVHRRLPPEEAAVLALVGHRIKGRT